MSQTIVGEIMCPACRTVLSYVVLGEPLEGIAGSLVMCNACAAILIGNTGDDKNGQPWLKLRTMLDSEVRIMHSSPYGPPMLLLQENLRLALELIKKDQSLGLDFGN